MHLSQDKNGIEEWHNVVNDPSKFDIHLDNQTKFNLPSRLIAKVFLFRWIYRGPAFAYCHDPDFAVVSNKQQYWQDVIDQYYSKYYGLYKTHMKYLQEVNSTGKLRSPVGREFTFKKNKRGEFSEYEITNYPNQSLGADVMAVARVSLAARFSKYKLRSLLISTIHDSLTSDSPEDEVPIVKELMVEVFKDLPKNINRAFGIEWTLPMCGEVAVGPNMKDLI